MTKAEELKHEIDDADDSVKWYDTEIADMERLLRVYRQSREYFWRRLRTLEGELAREEAPLVKPRGKCVNINGWDI